MPTTVRQRTPSDYSLRASFHTVSFAEVEYAEGGVSLTFDKVERPLGVVIHNTSLAYDEEAVDAPGVELADETELDDFTDVRLLVLGI